jgi:hypothetical protein
MSMTDLEQIDAWVEARAAKISEKAAKFVLDGGDINSARYRTWLGRHQAYMTVRSYLSGCRHELERNYRIFRQLA